MNLAKSQSDGGPSDGVDGGLVDGMKTMMMTVLDGFKKDMTEVTEALKEDVKELENLRTEVVDIRTDVDGLKSANETIDTKLLKIQAHAEQQEQYSRKDCIKLTEKIDKIRRMKLLEKSIDGFYAYLDSRSCLLNKRAKKFRV